MNTRTWTRIDTRRTRSAVRTLELFLEDEQVIPDCYLRDDGQIAVVYHSIGEGGLFAVKLEDAEHSEDIEPGPNAYTEFCDGSTDLADAQLAMAMIDDGESRVLKYSGSCSPVLADDPAVAA